jgi:hypothetical protein
MVEAFIFDTIGTARPLESISDLAGFIDQVSQIGAPETWIPADETALPELPDLNTQGEKQAEVVGLHVQKARRPRNNHQKGLTTKLRRRMSIYATLISLPKLLIGFGIAFFLAGRWLLTGARTNSSQRGSS